MAENETKGGQAEAPAEIEQLVAEAAKAKKPLRLQLLEPVQFGDELIEELEFRPMRGRDWYEFPTDPSQQTMGHFLKIAGRLTQQPPKVIDNLGAADVPRVIEVVALFMHRGR